MTSGVKTLVSVKDKQSKDNLSIVAAGVAFYWFLAIFPAIAAAVSIFGLVADPQELQRQIESLSGVMPQQAYQILRTQLETIVRHSGGALGLGAIAGILLTLWSANKGMKALITALNIVYNEEESRGFIKLNALSLLMTFCAIALGLIAIISVIAIPAIMSLLNLTSVFDIAFSYLRWPLLGLFLILGLALAYRFCPDRKSAEWNWFSWGSVSATVLWLAASILFSFYVANFGSYSKTYGSMGAVIILLLWFFITSYIVLLGGELNVQKEDRTK
ncbi:MAG: YihY/virulence factor BrkB family protein [Syntrophales bacterium]|nr:YihY/virulence factor BrkB family protein [Syntrophales bacterium]